MSELEARQRQGAPKLEDALAEAVRSMRARAMDYRNPNGSAARRMSKQVRQSMAATLDDYARLLESLDTRNLGEDHK